MLSAIFIDISITLLSLKAILSLNFLYNIHPAIIHVREMNTIDHVFGLSVLIILID